jgi:phage-related protein
MAAPPLRKPLVWIGSSRKDLIAMPEALRKEFGVARAGQKRTDDA